ncbi:hypothetical protein GCM10009840_11120 [Pseudolysinimonas kribbensis]|uniref:LPXTG cell wall anchor domain-containing protein n=1 Tax=Pseudolysinimonas kribbensis TaxID=433641 RepID=A0ABQ6KA17_9MICO|nr:hypothetical protein GCM10025881_23650 [Pseudolysinimonas kribbensis]
MADPAPFDISGEPAYGTGMDTASMILGAALASVGWIAWTVWSRSRRPEQGRDSSE